MNTNTEMYESLLQEPQWKFKRVEILNRDNSQCRNCGSKNNLQVHHGQYHKIKITGDFVKP